MTYALCKGYGDRPPHHAEIYARGLCWSCYRAQWNAQNPRKRKVITCKNCGKRKPHRALGLCDTCYMRQYRAQKENNVFPAT